MTAIFSPAVRLRRRLMRANFGDVIDHCSAVVGWHPDDTTDILIALDGDRRRLSVALDKWLRIDNRPGASSSNGARHFLDFIRNSRL